MRLELQGIGWHVKLYSGIKTTRYINSHTQVCTFFNNTCVVHTHAIRRIGKYLEVRSTYVYLPYRNQRLTTHNIVYRTGIEKVIECYVDANISGGWAQVDADNPENVMSCTGYVITYTVCPVLWCSKLQT